MKPDLKLVRPPTVQSQPYDEAKGIRRINILRAQLVAASVRYVSEGKIGSRNDRLRDASDMSGIPRNLIDTAIKQ